MSVSDQSKISARVRAAPNQKMFSNMQIQLTFFLRGVLSSSMSSMAKSASRTTPSSCCQEPPWLSGGDGVDDPRPFSAHEYVSESWLLRGESSDPVCEQIGRRISIQLTTRVA
jgi:hypothetical protein